MPLGFMEATDTAQLANGNTQIKLADWSKTLGQSIVDNWHQVYVTSDFSAPSVGLHFKWKRQVAMYKYATIQSDPSHLHTICGLGDPLETQAY